MEATSLPRGRALALPRRVLATFDDERLVQHLRRGNTVAFEVIYDRHHRGILAYARHLLGSREEAEDAVQQTFASAYDAMVGGDADIKLKAWLYTIARNRCLSILRARREQPAELDDLSTAGFSEQVQQRDDLRALLADLEDLPEPQRAALVLAEVSGMGHADIAAVLECDVAKVKSLVFQARSGLMERRQARETPCEEIREQLAVLTGGSLRRGPLRRHLKACPGCAAYREEVKRQRQMLAIALPVIPSLGLKESVLAAAGVGGGAAGVGGAVATGTGAVAAGGGAAAGGAAIGAGATSASGGLAGAAAALTAKAGLAKVAVAVVAGGAAVGGGTYAVTSDSAPADGAPAQQAPARESTPASERPGPSAGPPAAVPDMGEQRSERATERSAERRRRAARDRTDREGTAGERGRDGERRSGSPRGGAQPDRARERRRRSGAEPNRGGQRRAEPRAQGRLRSSPPSARPAPAEPPRRPAPQSPPRPAPETAPAPQPELDVPTGERPQREGSAGSGP